ncbi:facilitated trehalose transporter Tret1-like [Leptopilina boulardi]|uniref:facilitated trehalose transporter Tret1-like n=1 Tax=Leptopilina boulardi TaxID=63433 RepID=UPI0021F656DE|nr:facilitated trehalose transporter Tret1-like [Leptopilina boulardi]
MEDLIRRRLQYGAAVAACLGGFCLGCCLGWNSPCSELLKQNYKFATLERNLIGAALPLGCLLGVIIVPFLVDRIGRKTTMLIIIPPFVFGWLLIIFAFSHVPLYVIGRFITGFFSGMYCVLTPMYCAEISEKEIRGTLGVFFQLLLVIGILFAFCTGYMNDVMWISILNGITPIVFGVILFFMPESPLYFIMKGKDEMAIKAMENFRGANFDVGPEISEFKKIVDIDKEESVGCKYLFKKSLRKVLCVAYGLMIAQQLSGINAIIFYGVTIFEATGTEMDSLTQNVCVGIVQVIACTVSALIVDKVGRKSLMIVSEIIMCFCLVALGIFFSIQKNNPDILTKISWLPLTSCSLYIFAFCIGAGPIPWSYMGEIFPTKIKGTASSSAALLNWFLAFVVTISFESIAETIGNHTTMFLFAGICLFSVVFLFFTMLETKGKTFSEIQQAFGTIENELN